MLDARCSGGGGGIQLALATLVHRIAHVAVRVLTTLRTEGNFCIPSTCPRGPRQHVGGPAQPWHSVNMG